MIPYIYTEFEVSHMGIIRPMNPGDYPIVAQISNEAAAKALVGMPTWETAAEVAATVASLRHAEFIVAEDDAGRVVGFAGYAPTEDGGAMLFGPLVTVGGHGIGAWLSSRIETMARHHGVTYFAMLIGLTNRQGAAWAEWRGYQLDTEFPETLLCWVYPGELKQEQVYGGGSVRKALPEDLDRVEELYRNCYQADTATRADWAGWIPSTWVFEEDGQVLGLLHMDLTTAMIRHLCVEQTARRQGVGARLVVDAIQSFWRERPAKVGIMLSLDNQSGVSLMRRLGFRREIAVARWMKRDG
ncbi:MAG: GNAT family N-acetyltransferase [Bacillota bacterium]